MHTVAMHFYDIIITHMAKQDGQLYCIIGHCVNWHFITAVLAMHLNSYVYSRLYNWRVILEKIHVGLEGES